jgi:hypothetical protein
MVRRPASHDNVRLERQRSPREPPQRAARTRKGPRASARGLGTERVQVDREGRAATSRSCRSVRRRPARPETGPRYSKRLPRRGRETRDPALGRTTPELGERSLAIPVVGMREAK